MDAVLFDMDGVLVDSEPLHFASDRELLSRLGIEVPEGYLDAFVGVTNPEMWKAISDEFGIRKDLDEILNAQLSLKLKLLKKGTYRAIDGIPALLAELRKKRIPVGVASSSSAIFIKEVLKRIDVVKYVDAYVSGESVACGKPEPDVFLKAAELLGADPAKCAVIEDSRNGVIAAKRAGMKCVGFRNPGSGDQDLSKADLVIESISSIDAARLAALFA